jgi:hypothetical protein
MTYPYHSFAEVGCTFGASIPRDRGVDSYICPLPHPASKKHKNQKILLTGGRKNTKLFWGGIVLKIMTSYTDI